MLLTVFVALSALIGCRDAKSASEVPYADRFFLSRWSSWLWFYHGDMKYIQLGVVCSPALPNEGVIRSVSLVGRNNVRVVPSRWSLSRKSPQDDYQLYNLFLELDSVPPGTYELGTLMLTFADGSQGRWDVGKWTLVFDPREDKGAQYIAIGKRSTASGELDWYAVELTNISDKDITVKGLQFSIPGVSTDDLILIRDSDVPNGKEPDPSNQSVSPPRYSADPSLLLMKPGITRMFQFNFLPSDQISGIRFFTIKPLLLLEVNGEQVQASLSSATYGPWYLDDKMARELIEHGGRLAEGAD